MKKVTLLLVTLLFLFPQSVYGMHISEGYLPLTHSVFWSFVALPFLIFSFIAIQKKAKHDNTQRILLAMSAAFLFFVSSLKIPSVAGSCSHPTGVGLGTVMFGPMPMMLLGFIVLVFQVLLLQHGGFSTLGANTFSMAIIGPLVAWVTYRSLIKMRLKEDVSVFMAAFLSDLLTYAVTAIQLGWAHPQTNGGVLESIIQFSIMFLVPQVLLAAAEGALTVLVVRLMKKEVTGLAQDKAEEGS